MELSLTFRARVVLAKHFRNRMSARLVPGKVSKKLIADKWNHLTGVLLSGGRAKLDWHKIRMVPTVRCHRCFSVLRTCTEQEYESRRRSGELCGKCTRLEQALE